MSAKDHSQRIVILVIVGVFFLTALASTGFALYDVFSKKKKDTATTDDVQKQIDELTNKQPGESTEGKLEGTKLADFAPVAKVDTLQIIDLVPGTGAEATASSTVTAHYTGAVASTGIIFQSSKDSGEPFTSPLSGLIAGWQEGIPGMKVGGTRRLVIPAAQAYGAQEQPGIPANSDLVFDIELKDVK